MLSYTYAKLATLFCALTLPPKQLMSGPVSPPCRLHEKGSYLTVEALTDGRRQRLLVRLQRRVPLPQKSSEFLRGAQRLRPRDVPSLVLIQGYSISGLLHVPKPGTESSGRSICVEAELPQANLLGPPTSHVTPPDVVNERPE